MTRGQREEGLRMDPQNGAAPPSTQKRGADKEGPNKQPGLTVAQPLGDSTVHNDTEEEGEKGNREQVP